LTSYSNHRCLYLLLVVPYASLFFLRIRSVSLSLRSFSLSP
jgi:hypothetical protein